jgi:polar amino acid transport system substrate-binding protein
MRIVLSAIAFLTFHTVAFAQSDISPSGKLRTAMIQIKVLGGVAAPVAKFFAQKLGEPLEPVMYPNPEAYAQSFGKGEWDIAIGPRVLASAETSELTANLWSIDLIYVAAPGHPFSSSKEVDRAGVKVGVIQGSPSDRFLSRTLKSAEIVRIPLSPNIVGDAVECLRSGRADVFGADTGVGYPATDGLSGSTVVPGAFNNVQVAVAMPKGLSAEARDKLSELVAQAKKQGVVKNSIDELGLKGVRVAE